MNFLCILSPNIPNKTYFSHISYKSIHQIKYIFFQIKISRTFLFWLPLLFQSLPFPILLIYEHSTMEQICMHAAYNMHSRIMLHPHKHTYITVIWLTGGLLCKFTYLHLFMRVTPPINALANKHATKYILK